MLGRPDALLPPNSASAYGYDSVQGYDSLFPKIYDRLAIAISPDGVAPLVNGNMRLLDSLRAEELNEAAVRWVVTKRALDLPEERFRLAWEGSGVKIYENPEAQSRFRGATSRRGALDDPAHLSCSIDAASEASVVVADTFYPGWHAYVDGREAEIALEPPSFRRVGVSPQAERLDMVYRPASFQVGLFITLMALGCGAACAVWGRGHRKPRPRVEDTN